ncbi:MAG: cytochrome c3 family protein, partial [Chloroflexota bacterium]
MLRQRLAFVLTILITFTLVVGSGLSSMAIFAPFYAGDPLFPLQRWAEELGLSLVADPTDLATRRLDLAELRLMDMEARIGGEHELLALTYLDGALNDAVVAVEAAPPESQSQLRARLAILTANIQSALGRLTVVPTAQPDVYDRALVKAGTLLAILSGKSADQTISSIAAINILPAASNGNGIAIAAQPVGVSPHGVPFPPNAARGPHALFPLTGQHAVIACDTCHANAVYLGTPRECEACHAGVKPANHFPGSCDNCHSTTAWKPATFDHTGLTDCVSCHTKNKPANHWEGQCSLCHSTSAWKPATFDHTGLTDCVSCHTK